MKNAILIHGWASKQEFYNPLCPTASNSHWFPWLSKQLMIRDIHTVAVEMPNGYYPDVKLPFFRTLSSDVSGACLVS